MIDQQSQTLSTYLPSSPPKSPVKNFNDDEVDDFDPLYAIPNHPGTKNLANQQSNKSPGMHCNNNGTLNNASFPPPHSTSSETNSSLRVIPFKSLSPVSVPNNSKKSNLERSQSLRVSRKSHRTLSSTTKGGSLRYPYSEHI